jgi:hypothetical protein
MRTLKIKTTLTILLILILISACEQKKDFQYKDILEDWIDDFKNDDIEGLFGTWTIAEIANVGGTLRDESEIKKQLGKKLVMSRNEISFDLWETTNFVKPTYEILKKDSDDGPSLKGSAFFHGYRTCRKNVFFLIANGQNSMTMYFEIIHFRELTVYNDGRLFFLRKE